jgi:hypothetical protein
MSGLDHFLLPTQAATNEATSRVSRVAAHVRDAVHLCIGHQVIATYLRPPNASSAANEL